MQEPLPLSAQLEPDGKTKLPVWSAYRVISEGRAISLTSPAHRPQCPPGSTRCMDDDERQREQECLQVAVLSLENRRTTALLALFFSALPI